MRRCCGRGRECQQFSHSFGAGYATGRLRFVQLGARAVGVIEDEFDALTEALRRERDQLPPAACARPPKNR